MADFRKLIPFVQKWEGGFADDPDDKGGATMAGITLATFKAYCRKEGRPEPTAEELRKITIADWEAIFKTMFWDVARADEIEDQNVANAVVDWIWMSGPSKLKTVQLIVGVEADGLVGPKTIAAINGFASQRDLFYQIQQARKNACEKIVAQNPSQRKFLRGWLNRINDLSYE